MRSPVVGKGSPYRRYKRLRYYNEQETAQKQVPACSGVKTDRWKWEAFQAEELRNHRAKYKCKERDSNNRKIIQYGAEGLVMRQSHSFEMRRQCGIKKTGKHCIDI